MITDEASCSSVFLRLMKTQILPSAHEVGGGVAICMGPKITLTLSSWSEAFTGKSETRHCGEAQTTHYAKPVPLSCVWGDSERIQHMDDCTN